MALVSALGMAGVQAQELNNATPGDLDGEDKNAAALFRTDVLPRIDLLPTITHAEKERLHDLLMRSMKLSRLFTIHFETSNTRLVALEVDAIKQQASDGVCSLRLSQSARMVGHRAIFLEAPVTNADPTGSWVVGWWKVNDGNQYYYYFDVDGHVQYTKKPPATPSAPPKFPLNSGTYTYEPNRRVLSSGGYRELARWVFAYVVLVGMLCPRPAPTPSTLQHVRPEAN